MSLSVWRNGVQTSNPVDLGQRIMKEVAHGIEQVARRKKAPFEVAILDHRRVTVRELEHDLGSSITRSF
jgi:hypothetical protein